MTSHPDHAAHRVLEDAEVAALLAGDVKSVFADPETTRTFLRRVRATLATHAEAMHTARRDLARALEGNRLASSPLSAAVAALGRLTLEDQRRVFDAATYPLLDRMRSATADAHAQRLAAISAAHRVQLVAGQMLADPGIDESTRARLRAHLDRLARLPDVEILALDEIEGGPAAPAKPFSVLPAATELGDLFADDPDGR